MGIRGKQAISGDFICPRTHRIMRRSISGQGCQHDCTRIRPKNHSETFPDMQRDPIPDFTDTELGIVQHDDIDECVMTLLQVQADHVARESARFS